jgi:CubicO group peptidase (beta-lactamase class C family)
MDLPKSIADQIYETLRSGIIKGEIQPGYRLFDLRNGKWKDRAVVSEKWIQMARTPGPDNKTYGFANWYLNTDRKALPSAPETAVRFVGNGSNIIYIDWENDVVAVFRWIRNDKALNDVVGKMIASIRDRAPATAQP